MPWSSHGIHQLASRSMGDSCAVGRDRPWCFCFHLQEILYGAAALIGDVDIKRESPDLAFSGWLSQNFHKQLAIYGACDFCHEIHDTPFRPSSHSGLNDFKQLNPTPSTACYSAATPISSLSVEWISTGVEERSEGRGKFMCMWRTIIHKHWHGERVTSGYGNGNRKNQTQRIRDVLTLRCVSRMVRDIAHVEPPIW